MAFFDSAWVQILTTDLNPRRAGATEYRVYMSIKVPILDRFRAFIGS
jgi:hypothetical protein